MVNIFVVSRCNCVLHNIVRVIKSTRLRWAGHVARMDDGRSAFKILTGKRTGKRFQGSTSRRLQ